LTVLTGAFGMNVELPVFPGGPALQFWWIVGIMVVISLIMLWLFRRQKWL
jgi:Mg2+ and Co2+ transporter CorA